MKPTPETPPDKQSEKQTPAPEAKAQGFGVEIPELISAQKADTPQKGEN